jgi:cysteinyl-tRNA synthetase
VLRLFDTALGALTELEPRDPGRWSMYLCGPTVSGAPHLGHGRVNVVWDVARRYLTWSGLEVTYVSNVTDIEDKIIARAAAEGRSYEEVAAGYEVLWYETMARLGVQRPDADPHATAYVDRMIDLIATLIAGGHAYEGGDGVYFSPETVEGYGLLARQRIDQLRAGARVEIDQEAGKRSPVDFALWKLAKPGEPAWASPWGEGRPGWHTECVVMSLDHLGPGFDLHVGGLDLAFPHHENERAQAVAAGWDFARHWVHSGMVVDESGDKMSKSVGNTVSLPEVLDRWGARPFRLRVLQAHYRSPMTVTVDALEAAGKGVERLDAFGREFADARGASPAGDALDGFRRRMDDDLDTPGAVAALFDLLPVARSARVAGDEERARGLAAAVFEAFEVALGLPFDAGTVLGVDEPGGPGGVDAGALAAQRDEARRQRDWARADALRAQLQELGWTVEDGPVGTVIRR